MPRAPKSKYVKIRRQPSPADLRMLSQVAKATVQEIARMNGAIGHDAIAMLYVERLYGAVVSRAVRTSS
jgi:hypothetical protein